MAAEGLSNREIAQAGYEPNPLTPRVASYRFRQARDLTSPLVAGS
jgi:hypothetical protein